MNTAGAPFGIDGRVAVVTGASSGLGVALATGLADAGARIVLAARREDRLDLLEKQLAQRDGAAERTRTSTGLPPPAPQAGASTNSATAAEGRRRG